MSNADWIYRDLILDILKNGEWDKDQNVRPKWVDGNPAFTKSLVTTQMKFDGSEVPILTTKKVAWKSAIHELLWFYVKRTNDVSYLRENRVKIWEEWTREDNSIGKAYGYQLGKLIRTGKKITTDDLRYNNVGIYEKHEIKNQVQILIDNLKVNPSSRRHVISLWNIDDLHDMALYPCVWANQWIVQSGKLHLVVQVRSNDMALGNPFNVFQYYVLQRMIAQVTGYEVGTMTFNINNPHIYERHIEGLKKQFKRYPYDAPILWINPDVKNFDDFTIDDFKLENYQHHESITFEVAV